MQLKKARRKRRVTMVCPYCQIGFLRIVCPQGKLCADQENRELELLGKDLCPRCNWQLVYRCTNPRCDVNTPGSVKSWVAH